MTPTRAHQPEAEGRLRARNATPDVVLANVGIVPSAVNEIVRLPTQEGYSYFRH